MKYLKELICLLLVLGIHYSLDAQTRTRVINHRGQNARVSTARTSPAPRKAGTKSVASAKTTTSRTTVMHGTGTFPQVVLGHHKKAWVLPTDPGKPGYWKTQHAGNQKAKAAAEYNYNVKLPITNTYPYYQIGKQRFTAPRITAPAMSSIRTQQEDLSAVGKPASAFSRNYVFKSKAPGQANIHYAQRIDLGILGFEGESAHYLVVDTLFIPRAAVGKGTLMSLGRKKRAYIKIIASHLIYESPMQVVATHGWGTDVVFSAKQIHFNSPYKGLKHYQTNPAPPLAIAQNAREQKIYFYKADGRDKKQEAMLLNRLYVHLMQHYIDELATTQDEWKKDQLLAQFQQYRFEKLDHTLLKEDKAYQEQFHALLEQFSKYQMLQKERMLAGAMVVVDGEIKNLPAQSFKYYTVPTQAALYPVRNAESRQLDKMGEIYFHPTDAAQIQLHLNLSLNYTAEQLEKLQAALKGYGLPLEEAFPRHLVSIEAQPLRVNGVAVGRIVPVDGQHVRLEIDLEDNALTLRRLFLSGFKFDLDYTIQGSEEKYSQNLEVKIEDALMDAFDPVAPMNSFNVIEQNQLKDQIVLTSMFRASLEEEDALRYVEVELAFHFDGKTVIKGPYLLSHYATTVGSELTIPFVKHSDAYRVEVKGKVFYENGERTIRPFFTEDEIIVLNENQF